MALVDYLYGANLAAIRTYKWIELGVLKVFSGTLRRKAIPLAESLGIVFHLAGEPEETSPEEEKRILSKCGYNSLIHIRVNKPSRYFVRVANEGTMGQGEGYMDKDWEIIGTDDDLTEFAYRMLSSNQFELYFNPVNRFLNYMELQAFNLQTRRRAFEIGKKHYDLGNDLFESFLDPWLQYTCGYWAKADNLNDAQVDKMDLIARKLDLKSGMRVLDVGSGWGTLCKYLAENYGVECVGITVGEEGVKYAKEMCKGLPVEFRVQDYREVNEKFDRIVSVGMFEHVGASNQKEFFKVMRKCLTDDGIFLLHIIGVNHPNMFLTEPWFHTYIFPNGHLPYLRDITKNTEGLFIIEDWHNMGRDYSRTLESWRDNFTRNWPKIADKYGERFYRMWTYYLSMSSGGFKARKVNLWQIVMSKDGLKRDYRAAR